MSNLQLHKCDNCTKTTELRHWMDGWIHVEEFEVTVSSTSCRQADLDFCSTKCLLNFIKAMKPAKMKDPEEGISE